MKKAIQIKENIYWVGVQDFNLRHFHGSLYPVEEGATYNAYLIVDEQVTLIDTVEAEFTPILLERIHSVLHDRPIDNIIVQHAEPDHSSGFDEVMKAYPNATPYASNAGVQIMMKQYFHEYDYHKVKTGDTLTTGTYTLQFVEMPMIHWPDNMLTYIDNANIIFSNDAFGQHIVGYELFDDVYPLNYCLDKAKEYYANIVMPYGTQVANKLKALEAMNWQIDMIAPAHGVIWKQYITAMLHAYMGYATFQSDNKAIIIYDSVWHHTQAMAEALAEGLGQQGIKVKVYKYSQTKSSIVMKELLDAKAVFVGSGCYNNTMSSEIAGFLDRLVSSKVKGKIGLGFGSWGWFNQVPNKINEKLKEAGIILLQDASISQNYTPSTQDLQGIEEMAEKFAEIIKA